MTEEDRLREEVATLKAENQAQARQIEELRGAVAALLEPEMPRVLLGKTGVMIMDKAWVKQPEASPPD
ncbi:MAG TPA: hypothetical protein VL614_00575 [Acetobacteraceae bacterium]|jgi:hypothetical protein|nr:hypothetical protein [Acetobacteraceae bacterium]